MHSTTENPFQPTPGDGWVSGCFMENWIKFPQKERAKYEGKYVTVSLQGTEILGSGDSHPELWTLMESKGVGSTFYVVDYVDPPL